MQDKTSKFFILTRLQMLGLFSINKTLKAKGGGGKPRLFILGGLMLLGVIAAFAFSAFTAASIGMVFPQFLPPMAIFYGLTMSMAFIYTKAQGVLFNSSDHDMVLSLPVSVTMVVLSRLTMLYLGTLSITTIIFAPSIVIYIMQLGMSAGAMYFILSIFLFPLIPMVLLIALSTIIWAIVGSFRHKNLITVGISLVLFMAVMYFSLTMPQDGTDPMGGLINAVGVIIPPVSWLNNAILSGGGLYFLGFAAVSVLAFVLFVVLSSKFYLKIHTKLNSHKKTKTYVLKEGRGASPFAAMYKKELKRIFSNATLALNSVTGPLLLTAGAIALLVMGLDGVLAALGMEELYALGFDSAIIMQYAMVVVLFMMGVFVPTSVSLSLEGKARWIMLSLPLSAFDIFKSKIAAALTLSLPASLLISVALVIALEPEGHYLPLIMLIPPVFAIFMNIAGMYANYKFPKYDFVSEYKVVKGFNASNSIMTFGNMALAGGLGVAIALFHAAVIWVLWGFLILCIIGSAILLNLLSKSKIYL